MDGSADTVETEVLLQQFARYPEAGRVKTRLSCTLGSEAACAVHEELVARTAATLFAAELGRVELWLDRCRPHRLVAALVDDGVRGPYVQRGGNLGERMYNALADGQRRASSVLLVGSDCPGLSAAYLREASTVLQDCDVVLGPAEDGGYVLIGMRRAQRSLFNAIPWGTERVLAETLAKAEALGLSVHCLSALWDVDDERDYRRWRAATEGASRTRR